MINKICQHYILLFILLAVASCNSTQPITSTSVPKVCKLPVVLTFDDYKNASLRVGPRFFDKTSAEVFIEHDSHSTFGKMSGLYLIQDGVEKKAYATYSTEMSIGTVFPCDDHVCKFNGPTALLRSNKPTCSNAQRGKSKRASSLAKKVDTELVETVVGTAIGVALGKKILGGSSGKKSSKSTNRPLFCSGTTYPGRLGSGPVFTGTCR